MGLRPLYIFNSLSAVTDFIRQILTAIDRIYTSESDVYRRQMLTYKVGPRVEWVKTDNTIIGCFSSYMASYGKLYYGIQLFIST